MSGQNDSNESTSIAVSCRNCSLARLCLANGLDSKDIDRLDRIVHRRRPLRRGEHLFRVGDNQPSLYAVRSGSIKSYIPTVRGDEQILGFHLPGELVGWDAFEAETHRCAAVALERVSICELPVARIEEAAHVLPGLQYRMLKMVAKKVAADHAMLLLLGKKTAEQRLATFLLNMSKRFEQRGFSESELNLSMSRHDISNYLGLAVATVSRLLTRFQENGLLTVQRRLVSIHHLDRLHALARA